MNTLAFLFFMFALLGGVMGFVLILSALRGGAFRRGGRERQLEERVEQLETVVEELRDQVAELLIESDDRRLLGGEVEDRPTRRLHE